MPRKIATGGVVGKKKAHFKDQKEIKVRSDQITEKYKVRVPLKSSSASFPDVLRIIEKRPSWVEDKVQFATFDEINEDLKEIVEISMGWKVFRFYINDVEFKKDEMRHLKRVLFCDRKSECEGICAHMAINRRYSPTDIIRILNPQSEIDRNDWEQKYLLKEQSWVDIEGDPEGAQKAVLKHEELLLELRKRLKLEDNYCQIFNWNLIEEEVNKLPKKIDLNPSYTRTRSAVERLKNLQGDLDFEPDYKEVKEEDTSEVTTEEILNFIDEKIEMLAKRIGEEVEKVLKKTLQDAEIIKK